ncbi:MAG: TrkA C-terminal domain-containing protein, partial [Thermostichus sp. HHBFW_bins_43]
NLRVNPTNSCFGSSSSHRFGIRNFPNRSISLMALAHTRFELSNLIVAVRRADGTAISRPDRELVLQAGERVVVLGYRDDIPQLV